MAKQEKKQAPNSTSELVEIRVLSPLAGKYLLPYDPPAVIKLPKPQAIEIVESGDGEFVK